MSVVLVILIWMAVCYVIGYGNRFREGSRKVDTQPILRMTREEEGKEFGVGSRKVRK